MLRNSIMSITTNYMLCLISVLMYFNPEGNILFRNGYPDGWGGIILAITIFVQIVIALLCGFFISIELPKLKNGFSIFISVIAYFLPFVTLLPLAIFFPIFIWIGNRARFSFYEKYKKKY